MRAVTMLTAAVLAATNKGLEHLEQKLQGQFQDLSYLIKMSKSSNKYDAPYAIA